MLSKNQIKFIKSLSQKKYRDESGCFLAEGNKLVADLLPYFDCELLLFEPSWLATQGNIKVSQLIKADSGEIDKVSLLKNPQQVLAVFKQPQYTLDFALLSEKLSLVLDSIQDPGNLGTIIRIADWFGIENIICSLETADVYNPKTIQATMGALARVKVHYTDLSAFLEQNKTLPVYGTFLNGEDIYTGNLTSEGLIVMGNEGNGISEKIEQFISKRLYIPNYPADQPTSESLNVAVATAITCAEFRRRQVYSC
ncbi:MAG: RNA methyltransferase [Dysgonamonadaceae bacterium]|jgi:TrmH family RNA methyltransferase|nr:RNA methyltransferase [Dysgonamonadaceae bacterium]